MLVPMAASSFLLCPEHAGDTPSAQPPGLAGEHGQGEEADADGGQAERDRVRLELDRRAGAGERGQVNRRADHEREHQRGDGAAHHGGDHGGHGLGHDEPGVAPVAHDGEPGQGHLALRRPEGQAENHDEQAERRGGADGQRDDQRRAVLQRRAGQRGEHRGAEGDGGVRNRRADHGGQLGLVDARPGDQDHVRGGLPGRAGHGLQRHDHERPAARLGGGVNDGARHPYRERALRRARAQLGTPGAQEGGSVRGGEDGHRGFGRPDAARHGVDRVGGEGRERGARDQGRVGGGVHRDHRDRLGDRGGPVGGPDGGDVADAVDGGDGADGGGGDGEGSGVDDRVGAGGVPGGGDLAVGDAVAGHAGEGGQGQGQDQGEGGQDAGQGGPGGAGHGDEGGGAGAAGGQAEQAADGQRVQAEHDDDDGDGDQDRGDGQVQVDAAAGGDALVVQDDEAGGCGGAGGEFGDGAAPGGAGAAAGVGGGDQGGVGGGGGPAVLPGGDRRGSGQRGGHRHPRQPPAHPCGGSSVPRDQQDGQARAGRRGGDRGEQAGARRDRRDLPERSAPGAEHGQLDFAPRDDHPGRDQDHRGADHDQADEQQQQDRLDGRLGAQEQRQVRHQRRGDRQRIRRGLQGPGQPGG